MCSFLEPVCKTNPHRKKRSRIEEKWRRRAVVTLSGGGIDGEVGSYGVNKLTWADVERGEI